MELPRLEQLYRKYADKGLVVIAIDFEQQRERTLKFIDENKLTFLFLEDGQGEKNLTRNVFRAGPFPYTYIIDGDGRILYVHGTFREGDEKKIEEKIKLILGI